MKKLVSAFLVGIMATFSCVSAYAAGVNVDKADYDKENKKVQVEATITDAGENHIMTIMSTKVAKEGANKDEYVYNENDQIVYIEQDDNPTITDGKVSLNFALSEEVENNSLYFVRIGGSGIDTPGYLVVKIDGQGEAEILYGDVDGNGELNYNDAAELLNYVRTPKSATLTKEGLAANDAAQFRTREKDGQYTAQDVAMIMEKVDKGANYQFPVEKK